MSQSEPLCPSCSKPLSLDAPGGLCPRCLLDSVVGEDEGNLKDQLGVPEIEGIELQAEIGEGGFGIVYRAHQVGVVRRKVALKVLKPGVDTRQVLRRFEIESRALAHLNHPGIAKFYEAGQTREGYPYFTMEFVDGLPIHEAVGGRSLQETLTLFLQVCEGVAHAHDNGVIHRDLKPGNILVTSDGLAKVIDFGLAKALDAEQAPGMTLYTGGESWLGTPGYAAPEQLKPSEIDLDERVDVFALGAILYHLITGMNPEDAREIATSGNTHPLPSEIALQKIDSGLDAIILHTISQKRDDRYPSVRALMADLRRHLNGDPLAVLTTKPKTRRTPILAGAAILMIGLLIAWFIQSRPSDKPAIERRSATPEIDLESLTFEEMNFIKLNDDEASLEAFPETRQFCSMKFRKPDGSEFILSFDSMHGSPTVTQIFIGGKRPDAPGVRVIPFGTDEDQIFVELLTGIRESFVGAEQADELENTEWRDLPKGEDLEYRGQLKKLLGMIIFFKNHREARYWAEYYKNRS